MPGERRRIKEVLQMLTGADTLVVTELSAWIAARLKSLCSRIFLL